MGQSAALGILSDMSKAGVSIEHVWIISYAPRKKPMERSDEKEGRRTGTFQWKYDISFQHVSSDMREGKDVLPDISFTVPEGSTFGILGGTGSGSLR